MLSTGIASAAAATLIQAAKDTVSKYLSRDMHGTVSAFTSFLFALPGYAILLLILYLLGLEDFSVTAGFATYVFIRAVADCGAESCKMHAMTHGELSVVSAIFSLHPLLLLVVSPWITGDAITSNMVVGTVLAVAGTLLFLIRKDMHGLSIQSCVFALLAALFFCINNCFDRLSVQTASAPLSGAAMTFLSCVMLVIPAARVPGFTSQVIGAYKGLLLRGVFEVAFMVSKLFAMKYLTGPEVSAVLRLTLVFSVFSGRAIFQEVGFYRKLVGSVITVFGVAVALGLLKVVN